MTLDVRVESAMFIPNLSLGYKYVPLICRSDPSVLFYKYLCNLREYVHNCGLQSVPYISKIVTDIKM